MCDNWISSLVCVNMRPVVAHLSNLERPFLRGWQSMLPSHSMPAHASQDPPTSKYSTSLRAAVNLPAA